MQYAIHNILSNSCRLLTLIISIIEYSILQPADFNENDSVVISTISSNPYDNCYTRNHRETKRIIAEMNRMKYIVINRLR